MNNEKLRADIKRELNRPTSMKKLAELLPCPFCGSEAQSDNGFAPDESTTYAWCSNRDCPLHPMDTFGFTPESWNTRAALAAPAQDGWIPVSERLPEYGQEVIVNTDFECVCAGVLDSYGEWFAPCSEYKLTRITHWMPLPAAPGAAPSAPKADPVKVQLLEALEKTAAWIEQLPVPTVGAAGQLVKIDKAIAAAMAGGGV